MKTLDNKSHNQKVSAAKCVQYNNMFWLHLQTSHNMVQVTITKLSTESDAWSSMIHTLIIYVHNDNSGAEDSVLCKCMRFILYVHNANAFCVV